MRRCCNRNNSSNMRCNRNNFSNRCCNNNDMFYDPNIAIPSINSFSNNNSMYSPCRCGFDEESSEVFTQNPMYGHAYVPNQTMEEIFNANNGLIHGSIFPELISPYSPCDSIIEANYLANNTIESGCDCNDM